MGLHESKRTVRGSRQNPYLSEPCLGHGACYAQAVMKRRAFAPAGLPGILLLSAFSLVGCPIYDHEEEGCFRREDCAPGYSCDRNTGECVGPGSTDGCTRPSDCGSNETCDKNGDCRLGDCSFADIGCVDGYQCSKASGAWRCVAEGSPSSGGASSGSGGEVSVGGQSTSTGGASSGGSSQGGEGPIMGGFGGETSVGGQTNGGQGGEPSVGGNGPSGAGGA